VELARWSGEAADDEKACHPRWETQAPLIPTPARKRGRKHEDAGSGAIDQGPQLGVALQHISIVREDARARPCQPRFSSRRVPCRAEKRAARRRVSGAAPAGSRECGRPGRADGSPGRPVEQAASPRPVLALRHCNPAARGAGTPESPVACLGRVDRLRGNVWVTDVNRRATGTYSLRTRPRRPRRQLSVSSQPREVCALRGDVERKDKNVLVFAFPVK
jgi:hypothetical protein